jgi:hypothetical protein
MEKLMNIWKLGRCFAGKFVKIVRGMPCTPAGNNLKLTKEKEKFIRILSEKQMNFMHELI